jgi:hypothetical protein
MCLADQDPKRQEAATFTLIGEFRCGAQLPNNRPHVGHPQSRKTGSEANPNNRNRHRQADDEGADNH